MLITMAAASIALAVPAWAQGHQPGGPNNPAQTNCPGQACGPQPNQNAYTGGAFRSGGNPHGGNVGVPGPIAGAGLPFLLLMGGYALVRHRRNRGR